MTVLIAGGGIGGLTLALSLHQIGVPASVFESVPELKPLGVGINVLPHAVRELIELGLHDRLDAAGRPHQGARVFLQARQADLERAARHRGRLQMAAILDPSRHAAADPARCRDRAAGQGEHSHQPSSRPAGPRPTNGVRADFIDKATGKPAGSHDGALLIAADGIHSAVREKLYPQEGPPIWNGRILWRGITDRRRVPRPAAP